MLPNNTIRFTQRSNPNETGKKIKNFIYHYSDLIGKGNFARVYKGLNLNTQQIVAIKLVSLDQLKSKHLEALVFEEIRILQMMNHPNILKFYEALLSERNCYIVTELCNQGSLDDRIRSKIPLSQTQLGAIILDLYNGLRYLREKGVTHRDLKPANIFINNGKMKIADFGLAKFYKQRFHDLDIGSPQYMSPEGLILNNYSQKTDMWSFGITLYELLHGNAPFNECQNEQELIYHATRPIPEHKWRKDIHPYLRQMINRLLQIDEFKRPSIYQLANEPYLRALIQRQNEKSQQIKTTSSISLGGYISHNSHEKMKIPAENNFFLNHRPGSFTNGVTHSHKKSQSQQLYSTNSSQNSSHSTRNIHLENSMHIAVKYIPSNIIDNNDPHRFSFAKMNPSVNQSLSPQKVEHVMYVSPLQNRSSTYQISERSTISEGRTHVNIHNQLLFIPNQRQKSSNHLEVNSAQSEKKHFPPGFVTRPKNYFY